MTDEKLEQAIVKSGLELDANQKARLSTLFDIFEKSDLNWGDYEIQVDDAGRPQLSIKFVIS